MGRGDTELFKDKVEVSLDGRQIFYLFFGGAVIACLVFVLGVMVGKRVEARSHVHAEAQTSPADDPLAALDKLSADDGDLAFPEALRGDGTEPLGAVDRVLAMPVPEVAEAAAPAVKPAAKPEPAAKPAAKPVPAKPAANDDDDDEADDEPSVAAKPASASSKRSWTLQLSSFQNRAEADSFHAQLVAAGYKPYIVEAEVAGKGTWYRVRLGSYDDYDAALAAKKSFEGKQKIIAYVTRTKGR